MQRRKFVAAKFTRQDTNGIVKAICKVYPAV